MNANNGRAYTGQQLCDRLTLLYTKPIKIFVLKSILRKIFVYFVHG